MADKRLGYVRPILPDDTPKSTVCPVCGQWCDKERCLLQARERPDGRKVRYYKCEHCHNYFAKQVIDTTGWGLR